MILPDVDKEVATGVLAFKGPNESGIAKGTKSLQSLVSSL